MDGELTHAEMLKNMGRKYDDEFPNVTDSTHSDYGPDDLDFARDWAAGHRPPEFRKATDAFVPGAAAIEAVERGIKQGRDPTQVVRDLTEEGERGMSPKVRYVGEAPAPATSFPDEPKATAEPYAP